MDNKVTYGYTKDINIQQCGLRIKISYVIKWANDDNPAKRPYFIVKRTEVFDIIDIVGGNEL